MTVALRRVVPSDHVPVAEGPIQRKRGRPAGTVAPLTKWLRGVIAEMRRDGYGCAETWRRLCVLEDAAADGRSFSVGVETADECWRDNDGDVMTRFRGDQTMQGHKTGQVTDQGLEVFDASGRLIGHYR